MAVMSDAGPGAATTTSSDPLEAGRDALARRAWTEAFERLSEADRDGRLAADDLEGLAMAAFFAARADVELEVKERAFKAHEAAGNAIRAGYLAVDIARAYGYAGKPAISSVWKRRAERAIGVDGETYVHGYLALVGSESAAASGDLDGALALAERAVEIGGRAADPDLTAYAQTNLGALKIASGATTDGFALLEEASFAAVNGELSPFTSGVTACRMIGACRDLTDYRRASEWIEATEKYCDRESIQGFPGVCRIHRAEVAAVGGAWERAELELERATVELAGYNATPPQADGFYAIGDIRRLRGDYPGAEQALREAHTRGRSPQPALALIRLAQGQVQAAARAIDAAVAEQTWDQWARARLLPAQAEIAIAAGDLGRARTAVDELRSIVAGYPSPALEAGCRATLGRVLLAEGDPAAAAVELRLAIKGWRDVGAPYEIARSRSVLARALRTMDDEDDADLELQSALDDFRRLGARVDVATAEREIQDAADRRHGPQTARMTFMFTDIVGSTTLAEELGDVPWERLLRWHDDTIRALVDRSDGQIVNSTGDGFFAAFTTARAAVDAAVAIQQALAEHRTGNDAQLSVRIGVHATEATRRGADYSGMGVHIAARIAALAEGGEILASIESLAEAGDVGASASRVATIRGASAPVTVAAVEWSAGPSAQAPDGGTR
jgi:class 3 adenylate cyclase